MKSGKNMALIEKQVMSVSELTDEIKNVLEGGFRQVWVTGEVSNLRVPSSGHMYFTLKDGAAQLRGVIFRSRAVYLPKLKDGVQVLLRGGISVYSARGEYQIIGEYLELYGHGSLQLAFEELKRKLYAEGLFEKNQPLPLFPNTIGIVTSPSGAAIKDILNVASRRYPLAKILVYPSLVQGPQAPSEIISGIEYFNKNKPDVILLTRGGGSIEDLWAFNSEALARSIHSSTVPVVSAVGHEIDFTIADFVADMRAPTPSAAAEIILPDIEVLLSTVHSFKERVAKAFNAVLQEKKSNCLRVRRQAAFLHPQAKINQHYQRLDDIKRLLVSCFKAQLAYRADRLKAVKQALLTAAPTQAISQGRASNCVLIKDTTRLFRQLVKDKRKTLEALTSLLQSYNPDNTLNRGYAVCRRVDDGSLITDSSNIVIGDGVSVQLAKGRLGCEVTDTLAPAVAIKPRNTRKTI